MAYIGNQPTDNFVTFATQNFSTSATSSYTLDHAVSNENEIALFINNVRQHPGSGKAYTATGTALTLSENTASTDVMYCIFLGRAIQSTVPATNSITADMIGNTAISGKDALASAPADTDELLVSDAGTLKRIDYSLIKTVNTPAFIAYRGTSVQSLSDETETTVVFNTTDKNVGSCYDTSNGRFTPDVAGTYFLQFGFNPTRSASNAIKNYRVRIYKNGSTKQLHYEYEKTGGTFLNRSGFMGSTTVVANGSDDYFTVAVYVDVSSGTLEIAATRHDTFFCGFKIIE